MGAFGAWMIMRNASSGGRGGGSPIRRCKKCGEPITGEENFWDRHVTLECWLEVLGMVAVALLFVGLIVWGTNRVLNPIETGSFAHFLWSCAKGLWELLKNLW